MSKVVDSGSSSVVLVGCIISHNCLFRLAPPEQWLSKNSKRKSMLSDSTNPFSYQDLDKMKNELVVMLC